MKKYVNPMPAEGLDFRNNDWLTCLQDEPYNALLALLKGLAGTDPAVLTGCVATANSGTITVTAGYVYLANDIHYFAGGSIVAAEAWIVMDTALYTQRKFADGLLKNALIQSKTKLTASDPGAGAGVPMINDQPTVVSNMMTVINNVIATTSFNINGGTHWFNGAVTDNGIGQDDDFWIITGAGEPNDGKLYKKVAGVWVYQNVDLTGATGTSGTRWLNGAVPDNGQGQNDDFWLITGAGEPNDGKIYKKVAGAWVYQNVDLTGPAGSATNGTNGASFLQGTGSPAVGLGANGDSYLNNANGDLWAKSGGTWALTGNIGQFAGGVSGPNYLFSATKTIEQILGAAAKTEFADDSTSGNYDYGNTWFTNTWTANQALSDVRFAGILNFEVITAHVGVNFYTTITCAIKKNVGGVISTVATATRNVDDGNLAGYKFTMNIEGAIASIASDDKVYLEISIAVVGGETIADVKMLTNSKFFNLQD